MKRTEEAELFFDRTAEAFRSNYKRSPSFTERSRLWTELIDRNLWRLDENAFCFDIGCGDGILSSGLAGKGKRVVGIDQSEGMLSLARRRAREKRRSTEEIYLKSEIPLPLPLMEKYRGRGGLILCSSVLEYVAEYERALVQFYDLLKPGGALIASFPNRLSVYRVGERLLRAIFPHRDSYLRHQKRQFSLRAMEKTFLDLGYRQIEARRFALPFHRYSSKVFGAYRGEWLATMFLIVAEKRG